MQGWAAQVMVGLVQINLVGLATNKLDVALPQPGTQGSNKSRTKERWGQPSPSDL